MIACIANAHQRGWKYHFEAGWSSCAIAQDGSVRIISQLGHAGTRPAARVAERLRDAASPANRRFIPEGTSLLDVRRYDTERLLGHRKVTNAYLLGLAWAVVRGATWHDLALPRR